MRPYAVFIHERALAAVPKSGAMMREIMAFIRKLADNPNTQGDFSEQDETGRVIQVKVVGRYAVTFWADHPVCEVKVTHIKPADK
jgi:hypothetical protein